MMASSEIELRFDHANIDELNDTLRIKIGTSVIPKAEMFSPDKLTKHESMDTKRGICSRGPIFIPFGRFIIGWNTFLFAILMYSVCELPFSIAFEIGIDPTLPINIINFLVDACLMIDIVIVFRTAYICRFDRLRIIHDPGLIAKRYLKSWFFVDLLSCLPLEHIIHLFSKDSEIRRYHMVVIDFLRIIKLLRIVKIVNTFKFFSEHRTKNKKNGRWKRTIFTTLQHLFLMVLVAHYFACFWYGIGVWSAKYAKNSWIQIIEQNEGENVGNFVKYSYSFYWAIVTLFTTGYGDISAKNIYEQWTCCFAILIGGCFFAYFIGVLTMRIGEDHIHESKQRKMEESLDFCAYHGLPKELTRAITTHIGYYNRYNYPFNHKETMSSLPCYLQKEVEEFLADTKLRELDMFGHLPKSIVGQIALKLKSKSVGAGKVLFEKDDIGKEIFIQRTGQSEVYIEKDQVLDCLGRGDVIGENVILSRKRSHSVRCTTWSEFFVLNVDDIVSVLKENFDRKTAKEYWSEIGRIIESTKSLSIRSKNKCPHRHVRLKTIRSDAKHFDLFDAKCVENVSNASIVDLMERSAIEEDEKSLENEDDKKTKNHNLKISIGNLFWGRTHSYSRNEKVMKNFGKSPQTKKRTKKSAYHVMDVGDCTSSDEEEDEEEEEQDGLSLKCLENKRKESQSGGFWHSESFDIDKANNQQSNENLSETSMPDEKTKLKTMDFNEFYLQNIETISSSDSVNEEQSELMKNTKQMDRDEEGSDAAGDNETNDDEGLNNDVPNRQQN